MQSQGIKKFNDDFDFNNMLNDHFFYDKIEFTGKNVQRKDRYSIHTTNYGIEFLTDGIGVYRIDRKNKSLALLFYACCSPNKRYAILEGTTEIKGNGLCFAENLEEVVLPNSLLELNDGVFEGFQSSSSIKRILTKKGSRLEKIDNYAFSGCYGLKLLDLSHASNLNGFDYYNGICADCSHNIDIKSPPHIEFLTDKSILDTPFYSFAKNMYFASNCKSKELKRADGSSCDVFAREINGKTYLTDNQALYLYDEKNGGLVLIAYCMQNSEKNYAILDGTIEIAPLAFEKTKFLRNIIIPSSVKKIGNYAFMDSGIENFQLPSDSQLKEIGLGIFSQCLRLKKVNFTNAKLLKYPKKCDEERFRQFYLEVKNPKTILSLPKGVLTLK